MNKNHQYNQEERETRRIEAFSDGVFAIAVTLLVLDIKVPDTKQGMLMTGLLNQWSEYLSYVTSFLVIGIIWTNHHNTFKYITRSNNIFLLLNIFYLMCIGFIPYPTELLSEYIQFDKDGQTASKIYSGTMAATSIIYGLMWWYASNNHRLIDLTVTPETIRRINRMNVAGIILYVMSFFLSFWNAYFSLVIYFILTLIYLLPDGKRKRR
ncbi:MAG TPA: TMEM175 family protein [Cytophagaceae bacterium]|jgi:uncharacterized membrane protein|nr:TMEM175 family protein [Cytophagaceae bacterium]